MKRTFTLLGVVAALAAATLSSIALGATGAAASPQASKGALVALGKTRLGTVLVDARGRTLYLFEKDRRGRSACDGGCAAYWPPYTSSAAPRAGRGVRASLLGVSKRTDGKRQVTYAGHPLYTFVGDTRAGATTGEGLTDFGAAWYAVAPSGRAVKRPASDPDGPYGGYGSKGAA
jgi:predicted lipoprotein with Yx(FWY)xxD motif